MKKKFIFILLIIGGLLFTSVDIPSNTDKLNDEYINSTVIQAQNTSKLSISNQNFDNRNYGFQKNLNDYIYDSELLELNSTEPTPETQYAYEINDPEDYFLDLGYGTGWSKVSESHVDKTGNEEKIGPREINMLGRLYPDEPYNDDEIQRALDWNEINHYGGCGAWALINQLNYLAENKGYTSIVKNPYIESLPLDPYNDLMLSRSKQDRILMMIDLYEDLSVVDFGTDKGVWTSPTSFVSTSEYLLEKANLSDVFDIYYTSLLNFGYADKIKRIDKSIENGMPAIVWTGSGVAGVWDEHYFNIYSKETWTNNEKTKIMYKIRPNWGRTKEVYIDQESLKQNQPWGIMIFEEKYSHYNLNSNMYGYSQLYNNENEENHHSVNDLNFTTNKLRTGYIHTKGFGFDSEIYNWYLTLSSKRENAGLAYLQYEFNKQISGINIDVSFWSGIEGISSRNSTAWLEVKQNGNWVQIYDFLADGTLSKNKEYPDNFTFFFEEETSEMRIVVTSPATGADSNKGRITVGNIDVFV